MEEKKLIIFIDEKTLTNEELENIDEEDNKGDGDY